MAINLIKRGVNLNSMTISQRARKSNRSCYEERCRKSEGKAIWGGIERN